MIEVDSLLLPLNLPDSVRHQARRLLIGIQQARSAADLTRAAVLAEGFGLGIETLRALNPSDLEALYLLFEQFADKRRAELVP